MYSDIHDILRLVSEDVNPVNKYRIISYNTFKFNNIFFRDSTGIRPTDGDMYVALRLRAAEFMHQSGQKRIDFRIEELQKYKITGICRLFVHRIKYRLYSDPML